MAEILACSLLLANPLLPTVSVLMSQPKAGDDPRSPNNVLFRTAILGSSIKGDLRV